MSGAKRPVKSKNASDVLDRKYMTFQRSSCEYANICPVTRCDRRCVDDSPVNKIDVQKVLKNYGGLRDRQQKAMAYAVQRRVEGDQHTVLDLMTEYYGMSS